MRRQVTAPAVAMLAAKTTTNWPFWAADVSPASIEARKTSKTVAADWSPWRQRERPPQELPPPRPRPQPLSRVPSIKMTTPRRWRKTKSATLFTSTTSEPLPLKDLALYLTPARSLSFTTAWLHPDPWQSARATVRVCCSTFTQGCKCRTTALALLPLQRHNSSRYLQYRWSRCRLIRTLKLKTGKCPEVFQTRPSDALLCTSTWLNLYYPRLRLSSSSRYISVKLSIWKLTSIIVTMCFWLFVLFQDLTLHNFTCYIFLQVEQLLKCYNLDFVKSTFCFILLRRMEKIRSWN